MASNDYVQKYYDSLLSSYDLLIDAVAKAKRNEPVPATKKGK